MESPPQGKVDGVHERADEIEDLELPADAAADVVGGAQTTHYFVDTSDGLKVFYWKD